MNKRSAVLAAAAAALFVGGQAGVAAADSHEAEGVKCEGVNSCKGQSDCKTDHSECNGHNECAGKGWKQMTQDECDAAKAAKPE